MVISVQRAKSRTEPGGRLSTVTYSCQVTLVRRRSAPTARRSSEFDGTVQRPAVPADNARDEHAADADSD